MQLLLLASPLPLSTWHSVRLLGLWIKTTVSYLITSFELSYLVYLTLRLRRALLHARRLQPGVRPAVQLLCGGSSGLSLRLFPLSWAIL
jgi:hypothetical protein